MTQTTHPVSPLRQRMIDDMTLRKLSPKTQTTYLRAVKKLTRFLGRSPGTATAEDLRRFQLHRVDEVTRVLQSAGCLKYRAALGVAYGAGLRASEVCHLTTPDITFAAFSDVP